MKTFVLRTLAYCAGVAALYASCGAPLSETIQDSGNDVQERIPGTDASSWQDQVLVSRTLSGRNGVRVNLRTNYATYFENGSAIAKWKVASARPGKATPRGIFSIHHKDVCPPWNLNGASAGPCAPENPLGKKALWFNSGFSFGLHGVNPGALWSVTDPNPRTRDQSSGCVRNHPENIEWLFARVQVGTPVVVGAWDQDPEVVDCSGDAGRCTHGASADSSEGEPMELNVSAPVSFPAECKILVAAGSNANLRSEANTQSAPVAQLVRAQDVTATDQVQGMSVRGSTDWYLVDTGSQQGFVHSSLLSCSN